MLEKIKNDISKVSVDNYMSYQPVLNKSTLNLKSDNQVSVENLDLGFSNEKKFEENVTREMTVEAIKDNFAKNREITKKINTRVYEGFQNKISHYIAKNGVDSK